MTGLTDEKLAELERLVLSPFYCACGRGNEDAACDCCLQDVADCVYGLIAEVRRLRAELGEAHDLHRLVNAFDYEDDWENVDE